MKKVKRSKLNNDLKIQKALDSELKFTDINYKSLLSTQCNDFPTRIPRPIIKKEMETNNESKTERKENITLLQEAQKIMEQRSGIIRKRPATANVLK